MRYLVVLVITFSALHAVPVEREDIQNENEVDPIQNNFYKSKPTFIDLCSQTTGDLMSFLSCTAQEALNIIRKVSKIRSFEILPGIAVLSNKAPEIDNSRKIESDHLPADPNQRFVRLMELIMEAAGDFISGRTIKVKFPEMPPSYNVVEEGRGKKKKKKQILNAIITLLGLKLMSTFPAIAVVGAIAVKALLAAKLAFILATTLGVQSLFGNSRGGLASLFGGNGGNSGGHGGGGWASSGGWSSPGEDGWGRSLISEEKTDSNSAQELAYSQQKP